MIARPKYKWLLFDLDNTLIDFHQPSELSFRELCQEAGLQYSPQLYKSYQLINKRTWDRYEDGDITSSELKILRFQLFLVEHGSSLDPNRAHTLYTNGLIAHSKVAPEVQSLLTELSQSHQLAIITNGLLEAQRPRLKKTGIANLFKHIVVSDEIEYAKPQPQFFDYTLDNIALEDRSQALIIGDSLTSDIKGGNLSNIDTVWYNPQQLPLHSGLVPTYQISQLHQLKQHL